MWYVVFSEPTKPFCWIIVYTDRHMKKKTVQGLSYPYLPNLFSTWGTGRQKDWGKRNNGDPRPLQKLVRSQAATCCSSHLLTLSISYHDSPGWTALSTWAFFKQIEDLLLVSIRDASCFIDGSSFSLFTPHYNQVSILFLRDRIWNPAIYPGALNERRGDWATAILKSPLCAHNPRLINDKVSRKKPVRSGHRNCFLGMEICILFFICPKIMLWVDFQELAAKKSDNNEAKGI